jgi:tetratricopeptide (TPR) repeat protein
MDLQIEAELQESTLIHIGFPKCASKTLQNLFSIHESLTYINNRYTFDLLISPHPFCWNGGRARDGLSQLLVEARELGTVPVISDERLIGHPHSGFHDAVDIANRLQALMPRAKVLICIREQINMLISLYKQVVKAGCTLNVSEYLTTPWDTRRPRFCWEFYQYRQIIELYQTLFGKERVHIVLIEQLRDEPEAFYADLYRLLGVDPCPSIDIHEVHHAGMSDLETARRRLLNFFRTEPSGLRDPNPFEGLPINELLKSDVDRICAEMTAETVPSIKAEVRALFQGRFAASNRELSDLIGIDLAAFGYEVAPELPAAVEQCGAHAHTERFELEPIGVGDAYLAHNIVKYRGILYALPHDGGKMDLELMSSEARERLVQDRDLNTLKAKIEADCNRIAIIDEAYHGYKIVSCRQRYYAVPLSWGAVDAAMLQALPQTDNGSKWCGRESVRACRAFIDEVAARHWLEQHPRYQPLHLDLPAFLQAQSEDRLFGLPDGEAWAYFRLLINGLDAARHENALATYRYLDPETIAEETPLEFALRSSSERTFPFAPRANILQKRFLLDAPTDLQISASNVQIQVALGHWEVAQALVRQTIQCEGISSGVYTVLLCSLAALRWVPDLFEASALRTNTAQQTFTLLRDLNLCFLHIPAVQQALVAALLAGEPALEAQAYTHLGEALFSVELLGGAEAAFSSARALMPGSSVVHNNLAVLYWSVAQKTQRREATVQALTHIEEALRLDPHNAEALGNAQAMAKTRTAF